MPYRGKHVWTTGLKTNGFPVPGGEFDHKEEEVDRSVGGKLDGSGLR